MMTIGFLAALLATPYATKTETGPAGSSGKDAPYGTVESLTDFAEQTAQGYVVLDFYTDWCHYCKLLSPVFSKMAEKFPTIRFVKINADKYRSIASQYKVRGFPTVILLNDGKEVKRNPGFMNESKFSSWISPYA